MTVVAGKRRRGATDGAVQRLNVFISAEAHQRLMVNSVMERLSPGLFLEKLINDYCKAWNLPAPGVAAPSRKSKRGASANPDDLTNRPDDGADSSQESLADAA